jgi:hypothetical protein
MSTQGYGSDYSELSVEELIDLLIEKTRALLDTESVTGQVELSMQIEIIGNLIKEKLDKN